MGTSLIARLDIYISAATLAAHSSFIREGFRVRDLTFFLELFINWSADFEPSMSPFQTTQLSRYLGDIVKEGCARRTTRSQVTYFRLTRVGLLELIQRLTNSKSPVPPAQTLFRVCFVKSYRPWLERLVEQEGTRFPAALATELAALLDVESIIVEEIKRIERALLRIEKRIADAQRTSALTTNRLASGVPFEEIVREVEHRYPYDLNSMKPLHELISSISPDQRMWELQHGNVLRAATMWEPQRAILAETLTQLKRCRGLLLSHRPPTGQGCPF